MRESRAATNWIRAQVEPPTGLEAWKGNYPGTEPAAIVFNLNRGNNPMFSNGTRIWANQVWAVRAVTEGPDTELAYEIAEQIDEALHGKVDQPIEDGCMIRQCLNIMPLEFDEANPLENTLYRHIGALYEIKVQKIA